VLWLLGALVAVYIALCVGMFVLEPKLVFPAPQIERRDLHQMAEEFGATELMVTTEDGFSLYGWRYGSGDRLVLIFSGNAATVGGWSPRYERLAGAGFSVLHVNYRGYPGSAGEPSEKGLRMDARAAWTEALRSHPAQDIIVFGKSLGGGVAIGLVADLDPMPRALVLESTFTSTADVASEAYPWLPVRLLMRNPFLSLDRAGELSLPVLLLHGTGDRIIGSPHSERLDKSIPDSRLLLIEGAEHNEDLLENAAAWQAFLDIAR